MSMQVFCSTPKTQSLQKLLDDSFYGKHIPIDGMFELTHKCNFNCIHCYGKNERLSEDLTLEQIKSVLKQVHNEGCLSLAFTGGEALCRSDFKDIYLEAKKMGFMVILLSNASLVTEDIAKLFYDYPLCYFSTTMYGFSRETYKAVTGREENYDLFMRGLNLLDKYNIPIELKTIALRENYNDIEKIYNFATKKGYPFRCSFSIRATNDGDYSTIDNSITPAEMLKLDTDILKNRAEFWKLIALSSNEESRRTERCKRRCKYLCNAGENNFVIDASGNVHICASERRYGISLFEHSFSECWNHLMPNIYSQKVISYFPCHNCKYIRYCEQCSAIFDFNQDKVAVSKDRCELARLRYEWCLSFRKNGMK